MKDRKEPFGDIINIWQESQEAFLRAQKQVAEDFRKSFENVAGESAQGPHDPTAAWQALIKSWAPAWEPSGIPRTPGFTATSDERQNLFGMLDPQNWAQFAPEHLRTILEQIAKGPQFADLAMPQNEIAGAWRETLDFQKAASDMSKVMQSAWTQTYEQFSKGYSLDDLKSGQVKGALDAWLKAANDQLLATQRTAEYIDAQQRMMRAATEIKARQRDMAEEWCEAYQVPTRTEIDDLTKIVSELRRELRKTRRELANMKAKLDR